MTKRKSLMMVAALVALVAFLRPPTADIRILTHDPRDSSPHRVQAALDLGIMALSLLVTWTSRPR